MGWVELAHLVLWLPAGSWWQRLEHPTPKQANGNGGQWAKVIDINANPSAAKAYLSGLAPPSKKARR